MLNSTYLRKNKEWSDEATCLKLPPMFTRIEWHILLLVIKFYHKSISNAHTLKIKTSKFWHCQKEWSRKLIQRVRFEFDRIFLSTQSNFMAQLSVIPVRKPHLLHSAQTEKNNTYIISFWLFCHMLITLFAIYVRII